MISTPIIRSFTADEWTTYKDFRLDALTDSPDAFGSTLAEEEHRPDREWLKRLSSGISSPLDLPLIAQFDATPIGLAWGRVESSHPDVANLYQMWIAPKFRRIGAGRMLLDAVIAWARRANVSTSRWRSPAATARRGGFMSARASRR
jgi:GNAT superfamily N-acetyltransferase